MAVDKPSGMLVQSDQTGDLDLLAHLKDFIKARDHKPGRVYLSAVHRLDRPVSGLVLLAKTSKAASRLSGMFQERTVRKLYLGLTRQRPNPERQRLTHYLEKDAHKNRVHVYDRARGQAKKAETSLQLLGESNRKSLLLLEPKTGRPHQLRAQLARIDLPLLGDLRYGSSIETPDHSLSLHAWALGLTHPVTRTWIVLRTPFPRHGFWHLFEDMQAEAMSYLPESAHTT